jgi:ribonuclease D
MLKIEARLNEEERMASYLEELNAIPEVPEESQSSESEYESSFQLEQSSS